jgi:hypothetical protein
MGFDLDKNESARRELAEKHGGVTRAQRAFLAYHFGPHNRRERPWRKVF